MLRALCDITKIVKLSTIVNRASVNHKTPRVKQKILPIFDIKGAKGVVNISNFSLIFKGKNFYYYKKSTT